MMIRNAILLVMFLIMISSKGQVSDKIINNQIIYDTFVLALTSCPINSVECWDYFPGEAVKGIHKFDTSNNKFHYQGGYFIYYLSSRLTHLVHDSIDYLNGRYKLSSFEGFITQISFDSTLKGSEFSSTDSISGLYCDHKRVLMKKLRKRGYLGNKTRRKRDVDSLNLCETIYVFKISLGYSQLNQIESTRRRKIKELRVKGRRTKVRVTETSVPIYHIKTIQSIEPIKKIIRDCDCT